MSGRVLIVDDQRSMCELLETALRLRGFAVAWRTDPEQALVALRGEDFDVVLSDQQMPGMSGTELCQRVVANRPDIPFVVMTAFGSLEAAVAAIRAGAYDFVTKPIEMDLLAIVLNRAVKHRGLQDQVRRLSEAVRRAGRFDEILGNSPVMQELFEQLSRIAPSEAAVLITGESGTGKELVARSIHARSRRAAGPFVAVNCAAIPETLVESELFGHARGAFTDARQERKGLLLEAAGGTLLLDEIGELPVAVQPKLLRALEEGVIRPVGGNDEVRFDVRLLAATNRDLETAIEEQRFRQDLYFRINVIQVDLPPLRSRGTDVLLLAQHFAEKFARRADKQVQGLTEQASERLLSYSWPGNVRELRNVMERAVALTRFDRLGVDDLPDKIRDYRAAQVFIGGDDPSELVPLEEIEARYIQHVLRAVGGNKTLAARILGLDRRTLYRKLREHSDS
ncbi:MAG: sigma-54-dependent Fis family transcriptional regulator [Pirellulaceae bacterium]|nr:sigma-54-dependent Fis family transcriptional regulator [Pirellulaceae bacterium]